MTAVLATLAELDSYLGGAVAAENTIRQAVLDLVESLFESACGRTDRPFSAAQTARVEVRAGSGSACLYLDYPATSVTSVVLGVDTSTPDETLDPTDKKVLIWTAGTRRVTRIDGGRFGCLGWPAYVHVTYDAAADLPGSAKVAVLRGAATLYRQRGSEDAKSFTDGGYSSELQRALEGDPVWQLAVSANLAPVLA